MYKNYKLINNKFNNKNIFLKTKNQKAKKKNYLHIYL